MTEITERAQRPMRQTVGAFGEDPTCHLTDAGSGDRPQWRCRLGEIDVVALAGVICGLRSNPPLLTVGDPLERLAARSPGCPA